MSRIYLTKTKPGLHNAERDPADHDCLFHPLCQAKGPDTDPTESVKDVFEIVFLTNENLEIQKSKVIYTYTDGTTEEIEYVIQDVRPPASRKPAFSLSNYIWFLVPVFAFVIIVIILVARKLRK